MRRDRAEEIAASVRDALPGAVRGSVFHRGELTLLVERDRNLDVLRRLRDTEGLDFNFPVDIAGVDYLRHPEPPFAERFGVVYHLLSWKTEERIRVTAAVPEEDARIASACPLWSLANWTEREIYDMFGIHFDGHPDLRRILMWEEFEEYPLRKDYPLKGKGERGQYPVIEDHFPDARRRRRTTPSPLDEEFDRTYRKA